MNLKILIVDDDKKLLSVLKSLLTEEEHDVTAFSDGLEAIARCKEESFDLVITDLMMPGTSGMEVLKEARKIHPETLVILVTGYATLESAIQAIREGAYDYITKPFKLEEIKIVVRNAQERIALVRENDRLFRELEEAYHQLHTLKRIMGALDEREEGDADKAGRRYLSGDPLIAGSMLPQYYLENKAGMTPPLLSDLERISTLRERGLLSEEEFTLCKSKLLRNLQR
ncbi:MAG: response regulator [Deltaproteobacteria bacterium]|nr:response regulator [Deltaproteobacteria bacterium]